MLKNISSQSALILLSASAAFGQGDKKPNLREILDALESGDCEKAYSKTVEAMAVENLASDSKAKLVGLRITALAQLFIDSKITYKELKARTKLISPGPVFLIGHRYKAQGGLNVISPVQENPAQLFLAESNQSGTYMFCMFTIQAKPESPFKLVDGEIYFVSGNLASLECHPYGRGTYVFKAKIEDATLVKK